MCTDRGNFVPIYTKSIIQCIQNLSKCIINSKNKIKKRISRIFFCIDNLSNCGEKLNFFETLLLKSQIFLIKVVKQLTTKKTKINEYEIRNYLWCPEKSIDNGTRVFFNIDYDSYSANDCKNGHHNFFSNLCKLFFVKNINPSDTIKKYINSKITSAISSNRLYDTTSYCFMKIIKKLARNPYLRNYIDHDDIIFEQKGSMAMKRLLITYINNDQIFPDSDNDCAVLINPFLPENEFCKIHEIITREIHETMKKMEPKLFSKITDVINILENEGIVIKNKKFDLKHKPVNGFIGNVKNNVLCLEHDEIRNIKIQNNEIKFVDLVGCFHHFRLFRYKLPFECIKRILYGEILDIGVPYYHDCFLKQLFMDKKKLILIDLVNCN